MKTISKGMFEVMMYAVNGLVAVGDRTVHTLMSIMSNEFFLMVATIAAFILLMKS